MLLGRARAVHPVARAGHRRGVLAEDAERLQSFTQDLNTFIYSALQYVTFNTDEKPFPFCDWPAPDQSDGTRNYY